MKKVENFHLSLRTNRRNLLRFFATTLIPGIIGGCVGFDEQISDIDEQEFSLMAEHYGDLWPQNQPIHICMDQLQWSAPGAQAKFAQMRAIVETTSWPVVANINFTGWGMCEPGPLSYPLSRMNVIISDDNSGLTHQFGPEPATPAGSGMWTPGETVVDIGWGDPGDTEQARDRMRRYLIHHELGHALGFAHELNSPLVQTSSGGRVCPAADGEPIVPGGITLTPYFDAESVMTKKPGAICSGQKVHLSHGDIQGAQTAYGRRSGVLRGQNPSSFAVSRGPSNLDVFEYDGGLRNRYWNAGVAWTPWPSSLFDASSNGRWAAVSRRTGALDVLYTSPVGGGADGLFHRGWQSETPSTISATTVMGTGVAPGQTVAVVAAGPDLVDAFWVSTTGQIFRSQWNSAEGWESYAITSAGSVPTSAKLSVVSRTADKFDIFWIGADGYPDTIWCPHTDYGMCRGIWGTPQGIPGPKAAGGTPVSAVARSPQNLDIFYVTSDGVVSTSWWSQSGGWGGPHALTPMYSLFVQSRVTAVARTPTNLDVFYVAPDSKLYNLWWSVSSGWGSTVASSSLSGISPGSEVGVTSRSSSNLDVFTRVGSSLRKSSWSGGTWSTIQID